MSDNQQIADLRDRIEQKLITEYKSVTGSDNSGSIQQKMIKTAIIEAAVDYGCLDSWVRQASIQGMRENEVFALSKICLNDDTNMLVNRIYGGMLKALNKGEVEHYSFSEQIRCVFDGWANEAKERCRTEAEAVAKIATAEQAGSVKKESKESRFVRPDETELKRLRQNYPIGCRVRCQHVSNPWAEIENGAWGTVTEVDMFGTIQIKWDNGKEAGAAWKEDKVSVMYRNGKPLIDQSYCKDNANCK